MAKKIKLKKSWFSLKNFVLIFSNILITIIIMIFSVYFGNNNTWKNGLFLGSAIVLAIIILYVIFAKTILFENYRLTNYNKRNKRKLEKHLYLESEKDFLKQIDINEFRKRNSSKSWFVIIISFSIQLILLIISIILFYV